MKTQLSKPTTGLPAPLDSLKPGIPVAGHRGRIFPRRTG